MIQNDFCNPCPLLTVKDVAKMLQLSTRTIFRLAEKGSLPKPLRIGGSVRWQPKTIKEYLKS